MKTIFVRRKNAINIYVIHKQYYYGDQRINGLTKFSEVLPYFFVSRKQANRYLRNVLGASISHGVFITNPDRENEKRSIHGYVEYKIQHLSQLTELYENDGCLDNEK